MEFIRKQEKDYIISSQRTNELPEDAITFAEAGIDMQARKDIMSMRWHANKTIMDLWRTMTGRIPKKYDGVEYFVRSKQVIKKNYYYTDEATKEVVTLLNNVINPTTSLSHTSEQEAKFFMAEFMHKLNKLFVCSPEFSDVPVTRKQNLELQLENLIWSQLAKAVKGREAKMAVTNISEAHGTQQNVVKEHLSTGKARKENPYAEGGMV